MPASPLIFCDIKIPKSGNRLFSIDGITIFIRTLGRITYVYETTTGVLLMSCVKSRQWIIQYVASRIDEVKKFVKDYNANHIN